MEKAGSTKVIKGVKTQFNNNYYRIQIHRKLHVQKFLKEIGFSIVRKHRGLKKNEKIFIKERYIGT